jgi:hypothetical protein
MSLGDDHTAYPDQERLKTAAQALCYSAESRARAISGTDVAALIPSQKLWEGKNLPDGYSADRDVICLRWIGGGQIGPAPTSTGG